VRKNVTDPCVPT